MSMLDNLPGGSYVKWTAPGQVITGRVVDITERQARKFKSDELDTWDNGDPKIQFLFTIATDLRDPDNPTDDGERRFDVNKWGAQLKALRTGIDAFKTAHGRTPDVGDTITVTYVSGAGGAADPRVYAYSFTPGAGVLGSVAQAPAPAAPAAAPAAVPAAAPSPAANAGDTARALLVQGVPAADVAAATGLPLSTVAALANIPA